MLRSIRDFARSWGRLDSCLSAERTLLVGLGAGAAGADGGEQALDPAAGAELRRAFAVVLDDLATGLHAFAELVNAEFGGGAAQEGDEALGHLDEIVRETRAVLTELMLLDVDSRGRPDLWMLQGSVLAAVDHILRQLDVERAEGLSETWLSRYRMRVRTRSWPARRGAGPGRA